MYSDDEFAKLSESFVCVRTYVGVKGAEAMLKEYGIVGTGRHGPWVQGNNIDYVFFSPNLKPLTHRELKEVTPQATADSQNSIRWRYTVPGAGERETTARVATDAMKKILATYPPKDKETIRIPWQLNADTAVHFASYEDRRIILVPHEKGELSPALAKSLTDAALLRKHVHNYVFLKAEAQLPAELQQALKQAGPDGLVIIERPQGRVRGESAWQVMKVLTTTAAPAPGTGTPGTLGPHTPTTLLTFLDQHIRLPGWDAPLTATK